MRPNSFQVPGEPASTHTQPTFPSGAGAECQTLSPTRQLPAFGGAVSWTVLRFGMKDDSVVFARTEPVTTLFSRREKGASALTSPFTMQSISH
jgi:hypothetical protein